MVERNDLWQHLAITWDRYNTYDAGTVKVYHNGQYINNDKDLSKDKNLDSNGKLIVGQTQGSFGGGFDNSKLMVGHLNGLNIWSRVLTDNEIKGLHQNCTTSHEGDVVKWSDILGSSLPSSLKKVCPSSCS